MYITSYKSLFPGVSLRKPLNRVLSLIKTSNAGFKPDRSLWAFGRLGCIWLKASILGIYPILKRFR